MSEVQSTTNMTKDIVAGRYDAGEVAESDTLVCKDVRNGWNGFLEPQIPLPVIYFLQEDHTS